MNEEIILKMVQPYLKNSSITYEEFDKLFEMLSLKEQYCVLDILHRNNIELQTDEKELDHIENLDEISIDEEALEILYDDSIFFDQNNGSKEDDKTGYSGFLEVRKNIKQSYEILCVLIQQGNAQARQDLCIKNRRLVDKIANIYVRFSGNDLAFDDLEQAGMIGILTAAERFDTDRGYAFSTYATWWIKQAIVREIYDHGFTIRVPVHMMETIHKINVLDRNFTMIGMGYKERLKKMSEQLSMTEENIEQCMMVQNIFLNTSSLDIPVRDAEDTIVLELIPDEAIMSVEDEVFTTIMREQVVEALQILTKKEQMVLDLRFGLTDGVERTLEEIGNVLGVTRERIRQIEQKAFRKIRHPSNYGNLRDFL